MAKALDDRVGCAIVVECLRRLASREGLAHDMRDVEAVAALVVAVLEDLDAASWQRMLE